MQRTHPCCCWCFRRPSHAHLSRTTGPYSCQENGIPSSCPERAPVWMRSLVSLFLYDDPTDIFSQQMYQVNDGMHPPTGSCCSHSHREQDSTFLFFALAYVCRPCLRFLLADVFNGSDMSLACLSVGSRAGSCSLGFLFLAQSVALASLSAIPFVKTSTERASMRGFGLQSQQIDPSGELSWILDA